MSNNIKSYEIHTIHVKDNFKITSLKGEDLYVYKIKNNEIINVKNPTSIIKEKKINTVTSDHYMKKMNEKDKIIEELEILLHQIKNTPDKFNFSLTQVINENDITNSDKFTFSLTSD